MNRVNDNAAAKKGNDNHNEWWRNIEEMMFMKVGKKK